MKDTKWQYSMLEKLALSLVITAQKLCLNFFSHPIIVLTNNALGYVLSQPEALERLIKWTIELNEYNI